MNLGWPLAFWRVALMFLIAPVLVLPGVLADSCSSRVSSTVQLSEDWFCPSGGPVVDRAGAVIDCQNHSIRGAGAGVGVVVVADRAVVHSCRIEGFEAGVSLEGVLQAAVMDSSLVNNRVGVFLRDAKDAWLVKNRFEGNADQAVRSLQSSFVSLENTFVDNGADIVEFGSRNDFSGGSPTSSPRYSLPSSPLPSRPPSPPLSPSVITGAVVGLPRAEFSPLPRVDAPRVEVIENVVAEEMFSRIGISPKAHAEASALVSLYKSIHLQAESLEVVIVIIPREDVSDLVLYEVIPKNLTASVFDVSSKRRFSVVEPDPIIRFEIGDVKKGSEVQIQYKVKGSFHAGAGMPRAGDIFSSSGKGPSSVNMPSLPSPSTILSFEKLIPQTTSWVLHALIVGYLFSFLGWFAIEWHAKEKKRLISHTAGVLIALVLFLGVYSRSLVLFSLTIHQVLLAAGLFVCMMFYAVNVFLMLEKGEFGKSPP